MDRYADQHGTRRDDRHDHRHGSGRLRRALARLTSSDEEVEAAELQQETAKTGCTPISELPDRERVRVAGTLRTVTMRPRAGVPALEAELYDGSGSLVLVWLGRRRIPGIEPGRVLVVHGLVSRHEGHATIMNPRYELRPAAVG